MSEYQGDTKGYLVCPIHRSSPCTSLHHAIDTSTPIACACNTLRQAVHLHLPTWVSPTRSSTLPGPWSSCISDTMALSARPVFVSAGLLLLTLVPPFPSILRATLAVPLWVSLFTTLSTIWIVVTVSRSERQLSPSHHRRYGRPTLGFETPSAWSAVRTRAQWELQASKPKLLHTATSDTLDRRLDRIFELIQSTFILPWFSRISPSPVFPNAVEVLVRRTLSTVVGRAESIDWSTLIVSRLTPIITDHLHHYRTVEHLSSSSSAPTPYAALPLPLPAKPHPALSQQVHVSAKNPLAHVEAHFRATLDRVVDQALPTKDASDVVKTLVREIVLGTILLPMFEMLCDSDFWNRQMDEKGGRYLHEQ